MFVFSTTLLCLYVFGFCWVYIKRIMDSQEIAIWRAMARTPASVVLIIYTFICVWFVGGLSVFHLYLISTNQVFPLSLSLSLSPSVSLGFFFLTCIGGVWQTTYENFRYRYDRHENPYNRGIVDNFKEIFFSSIPPSQNDFRMRVPPEQSLPVSGGSGFISGNMKKGGPRDLESGRKPSWDHPGVIMTVGDLEAGEGAAPSIKDGNDSIACNLSESSEVFGNGQPRRSSWDQRSGNWEFSNKVLEPPSDLGEPKRIDGVGAAGD